MDRYHTTVLLQEAIEALNITPGEKYIDATLGGGGHSLEIVTKRGFVLGIDQDQDAVAFVKEKIKDQKLKSKHEADIKIVKGNFREIDQLARENGFEEVRGVLFDLGVSGHQFDESERGFSFVDEAPLDMRMDQSLAVTAKDLVNGLSKSELTELFTKYGEEPFAAVIAGSIVKMRLKKPIETTKDLADIVKYKVPRRSDDAHPATRVFQALRIAVNDELNSLKEALPKSLGLLESNGRLVVISFHSLEDRIVKQTFKEFAEKGLGTIITEKPLVPSEEEIAENRRSRSAKMRVFEKK